MRLARILPLVALAGSLSAGAAAQNLLANGGFATDLTGWTVFAAGGPAAGSVVFSPLDAKGAASSGSALITNATVAAQGLNYGLRQCLPATAGASYDFGAKVRMPVGQGPAGPFALVIFYANGGCTGEGLGFFRLDFTASGQWQGLTKTGFVAPAGTIAFSFFAGIFRPGPGAPVAGNFDDAFFQPTGATRAALTIPVAASIHGANGTFFHSDAWIMNRSFTNENVVTAVYRCFGGAGCGSAKTITLAPREVRLIADIIATLFGVPESGGAIELTWDTFNGPITAQTRLFTPTSPPSYGFGVPGLPSSAAATRAVFVGVAGSGGNLTTGFRSNGGAYNPNGFPVTVTFTLTDGATGAPIGNPFTRSWGAFEAAQVSNLVTTLGAGSVVTTDAVLVATASGGAVFFYVATVDNASGDSIYVTASPDEALVP